MSRLLRKAEIPDEDLQREHQKALEEWWHQLDQDDEFIAEQTGYDDGHE